ncbi:hypothetical protein ACDW_20690 [Acidovorax sp. DW039]|uniref:hypothetical protein n=1 Tax=Acidovorax sp. DW039 TaxID=3095606 RepID=UPI003086D8AA|nr:hypothetical protein ACDW_20690 [Acidovorax sp. DW039]
MGKLRHFVPLVLAMLAGKAYSEGFGPPSGSLPAQLLPLEVPAGSQSPLLSATLFRSQPHEHAVPTYYLGTGIGIARLQIPNAPGAAVWQVVKEGQGAQAHVKLVPVALDVLQATDAQPVTVQASALPMECAAAFEGSCNSRDGTLRITTAFEGKRRQSKVPGGFFGTEAPINATFYTGVRTLSIEHLPSGRVLKLEEQLRNTRAYEAPQSAIRYLPELKLMLLLGVAKVNRVPVAHSVLLP